MERRTIIPSRSLRVYGVRHGFRYDSLIAPTQVNQANSLHELSFLSSYNSDRGRSISGIPTLQALFLDEKTWRFAKEPFSMQADGLTNVVKALDFIVNADSIEVGKLPYLRLQKLLQDTNAWTLLSRFPSRLASSSDTIFMKGLKENGQNVLDFLSWAVKDPLASDLLTRDLEWFQGKREILEKISKLGFSEELSNSIRNDVYEESSRIANLVREAGDSSAPIVLAGIREKLSLPDDYDTRELLKRIQFVSLDRGGRLLTRGLLTNDLFRDLLHLQGFSTYRGVKIDTEEVYKSEDIVNGYDRNAFESLRQILEAHPERDILLLVDLYGGVRERKKQENLQKLFVGVAERNLSIFTLGQSSFNDIPLSEMQSLSALDIEPDGKTFGENNAANFNHFTYTSPPFPWHLLMHEDGDSRLRKFLGLPSGQTELPAA